MLAVAALILLVSYLVSSVDGKSFSFFHSCCVLEFISESFFLYYYYISKKKCDRERRLVCCSKKGIEKYFFFYIGESLTEELPLVHHLRVTAQSRQTDWRSLPNPFLSYLSRRCHVICQNILPTFLFWLFTFHFCWKVRLYNVDSFVFFKVYYISIV